MARYFFNLRNDVDVDDEEGQEVPDFKAAQERATAYARDMAAASILERHKLDLAHRIEVADERGQVLHVVTFGDAVEVKG